MYSRWYSQSVRANALFQKLRPGSQQIDVSFSNVGHWVGGVIGVILVLFILLVAIVAADSENPNGKAGYSIEAYGMMACFAIVLCSIGGAITWALISASNRRLRKRLFAFDDATQKYDIKNCGALTLEEDYRLPLFHSEEEAGCPGKTLNAWLCGKWKEDEFAWLEGGQLVDPVFRGKSNGAINFGLVAVLGRKASRKNRLVRRGFEAVVFSEELALPDIVLGHYSVVETSYTKTALKSVAQPLPGIPATSALKLWGAVSDSRGGEGVYGALADAVNSRNCLIQVIGGRVVVFLNYFKISNSSLVGSLEDFEREMEFAHTIFQRLKLVAQSKNNEAGVSVDTTAVATAFKPIYQSNISVGKIACGLCMALFGGIGLFGVANVDVSKLKKDEPIVVTKQVEITEAVVKARGLEKAESNIGGKKRITARPKIGYLYQYKGQTYKGVATLSPKSTFLEVEKAKELLLNYDKGEKIQIEVDPDAPAKSVLAIAQPQPVATEVLSQADEKVQDAMHSASIFAGFLTLAGLGLAAYGFLGGFRKHAEIPDFESNSQSKQLRQPSQNSESGRANEGTLDALPAPANAIGDGEPAEAWSGLSSAKYFQDTPTGMLD